MTDKTRVKRVPKRGIYDKATIYRILDDNMICHVGFVFNNYPVVIPTIYGRDEDQVYLHGAMSSRMMTSLEKGIDICLNVTKVNGLVLARSAFHHSMNYESVVLFGRATIVDGDENKDRALKIVSDHMMPGRWEDVRQPSKKELKATMVLQVAIDEASAKVRTGDPGDDKEDYELDIWAGVLPLHHKFGNLIPDTLLKEGVQVPAHLAKFVK